MIRMLARFRVPVLLCLSGMLGTHPAVARNLDHEAESARAADMPAVTLFIDARFGARTHAAAEKLTESHRAFARHGYRLIDVEAYSENGDLVGFFVSYRLYDAGESR